MRSRSRREPNRSNSRSRQSNNIFRIDDIGYSTDIDALLSRSNSGNPIHGLSPIRIPSPSLSPPIPAPTPLPIPTRLPRRILTPTPIHSRLHTPTPIRSLRTPQSVPSVTSSISIDWSGYGNKEDLDFIYNELLIFYSENLFNYLANFKINFEQKLGRGANGSVYKATIQEEDDDDEKHASSRPREVVIKIMKKTKNSRYEYEVQKLFHDKGVLVPEPIWYGEFKNDKNIEHAIIIMDLNSFASEMGTFSNWLNVKQPQQILDYMLKSINFTMSDNRGNIVTVAPLLIDFGLASSGVQCFPVLEIVQLLRTLYLTLRSRKPYDIDNIDYLVNGLIELLLKYSSNPPLNINRLTEPRYVESLYEKLLITYYLPVYKTKIKRWEKGLPDKVVKIFK
jgi:hypothetical protein